MNPISFWSLIIFGLLFGFIFKDMLAWFNIELKKDDYKNIILFFPAFFFLIAFWIQPLFSQMNFAFNDITQLSIFLEGFSLWIAVALFVGSGARLLLDWYQNKTNENLH